MSSFQEGVHFYFDEKGRMVLTARYLLDRGYCCKNGCRHCPYADNQVTAKSDPPTPEVQQPTELKS